MYKLNNLSSSIECGANTNVYGVQTQHQFISTTDDNSEVNCLIHVLKIITNNLQRRIHRNCIEKYNTRRCVMLTTNIC